MIIDIEDIPHTAHHWWLALLEKMDTLPSEVLSGHSDDEFLKPSSFVEWGEDLKLLVERLTEYFIDDNTVEMNERGSVLLEAVGQRAVFEGIPDAVFSDTRVKWVPNDRPKTYVNSYANFYTSTPTLEKPSSAAQAPQTPQWLTKVAINNPEFYFDSLLDRLLPMALEQCRSRAMDGNTLKAVVLQRRGKNDPNSTPAPKI